jgi:DNA mismatch repair protein MSH2
VAGLIKYLELMGNETGFGRFKLKSIDLSQVSCGLALFFIPPFPALRAAAQRLWVCTQYLKMDAAAVAALNLFSSPTDSNKHQSLFGVLNHCKTKMGERLLNAWIKQPLLNVAKIERRLGYVQALVDDASLRQALQVTPASSLVQCEGLAERARYHL